MDRPLQDPEDQNPGGQNPIRLQRQLSHLHLEGLGGDQGPCQASDQEADRQDQSQTGRLDLDQGEGNRPLLFIQNLCLEAAS